MAKPSMTWTDLRSFSGASADSAGVPAASTFTSAIEVPGIMANGAIPRLVEFRLDTASHTGSPTAVTLKIYRNVGGKVGLIGTWTLSPTDITNSDVVPIILETYSGQLYPKLFFTGGSSPTFTATVQARAVE